jgi:hypothetical protein
MLADRKFDSQIYQNADIIFKEFYPQVMLPE